MADEFATAITFLDVKDERYRQKLKADEAFTRASAAKMQASLNTVRLSTVAVGDAGVEAAAAVTVLGQAATLTGNVFLVTASSATAFAFSMRGAAKATFVATVAARGLIVTLGLLAIAFTAGAAAIVIFRRKSREAKEEMEALEQSVEFNSVLFRAMEAQAAAIAGAERTLSAQVLLARTGSAAGALLSRQAGGEKGLTRQIALMRELSAVEFANAARARLANEMQQAKLQAIQDEQGALEALVAMDRERLRLQREDSAERAAAIQADVRAGLTGTRAPTSAAEAQSQLIRASSLLDKLNMSRVLFLQEAKALVAGGFDFKAISAVLSGLGIVFEGTKAIAGTIGSLSSAAFRGRTNIQAPTLGSSRVQQAERRDKSRNTLLEQINQKLANMIANPSSGGLAQ